MSAKPWLNPSIEQERKWQEQRLAALASTRAAVDRVIRLPGKEARRQLMVEYRVKRGDVCADALESLVRSAWEKRGV